MFSEGEIGAAGSDLLQIPKPKGSKVNPCSLLWAVDWEPAVGLGSLAAEVTDTASCLLPGAPVLGEIVSCSKTCHVPTAISRLLLESVL